MTHVLNAMRYLRRFGMTSVLPGQARIVQLVDSVVLPVQMFPPFSGAGFVQDLKRVANPLPHETLQEVHSPQSDHLPSTTFI